jgi:hypothetical protein
VAHQQLFLLPRSLNDCWPSHSPAADAAAAAGAAAAAAVATSQWSGHLISNFVYSPARSTTGLVTWLIARDIHTATSVSRNFFWTDVNMVSPAMQKIVALLIF